MPSRHVTVFAKEPIEGQCKTRLCPPLTLSQATELYRAFVLDTFATVESLDIGKKTLSVATDRATPFLDSVCPSTWQRTVQRGDDLGARMHTSLIEALKNGASSAVILGTDSPTLPPDMVMDAFYALDSSEVVFGPSEDGGYWLVGVAKPCPALFDGIEWSTGAVLWQSLAAAENAGYSTTTVGMWYDIDTSDELMRAKADLRSSDTHASRLLEAMEI